jgi:PAS domain S-box-containing protein
MNQTNGPEERERVEDLDERSSLGQVCRVEDIRGWNRADDAIRQERDRAQRYLDIADVILLALDLEGRITLINRKGCSTVGWEERELLGRDWVDACLPVRIRKELRSSFHNLVAGDVSYIENPVLTKSGEERVIGWRNTQLRDQEGRVTGTLSSGEDITERKRVEETLRQLSGQLLRLQDEERRKIARDLHDSTGQVLVALATDLSQLHASIPASNRKLRKLASRCQALADQSVREVRTLSYLLHPPMLDEAGLEDAIRHYAGGFTERTGIQVALQISPCCERMARDVELALFRVVQESLTNVQRHSGSRAAKICIECDFGQMTLEVSDRGHGTPRNQRKRPMALSFRLGVGIPSMRERVNLIGGQLAIESSGNGTTVRVTLPLHD